MADEVTSLQDQLEEKEKELRDISEKVAEKDTTIEHNAEELKETKEELEAVYKKLAEKEADVERNNEELEEKRAKLRDAYREVEEKDTTIKRNTEELDEKQVELDDVYKKLEQRDATIDRNTEQLSAKETELKGAKNKGADHQKHVEAAEKAYSELEEKFKELESDRDSKASDLAKAENRVNNVNRLLIQTRNDIESKNKDLRDLMEDRNEIEERLDNALRSLDKAQKEISARQKEKEEIQKSLAEFEESEQELIQLTAEQANRDKEIRELKRKLQWYVDHVKTLSVPSDQNLPEAVGGELEDPTGAGDGKHENDLNTQLEDAGEERKQEPPKSTATQTSQETVSLSGIQNIFDQSPVSPPAPPQLTKSKPRVVLNEPAVKPRLPRLSLSKAKVVIDEPAVAPPAPAALPPGGVPELTKIASKTIYEETPIAPQVVQTDKITQIVEHISRPLHIDANKFLLIVVTVVVLLASYFLNGARIERNLWLAANEDTTEQYWKLMQPRSGMGEWIIRRDSLVASLLGLSDEQVAYARGLLV